MAFLETPSSYDQDVEEEIVEGSFSYILITFLFPMSRKAGLDYTVREIIPRRFALLFQVN
jgi:hypothetical protein